MIGKRVAQGMRFAGCAALLALLAASSYAAVRPAQVPSVPEMAMTMPGETIAGASMEETRQKLAAQRNQALALLQSVLDDPRAKEAQIGAALEQKTQIADFMEKEAAAGALLEQMGFGDAAVVMSEAGMSIIVPWQIAENEQNRIRMIDAAVSQSGISAQSVKIILAKNE